MEFKLWFCRVGWHEWSTPTPAAEALSTNVFR